MSRSDRLLLRKIVWCTPDGKRDAHADSAKPVLECGHPVPAGKKGLLVHGADKRYRAFRCAGCAAVPHPTTNPVGRFA